MTTLPVGLHENVPAAVYHADCAERPSLSASVAKVLDELSVAHARAKHPRFVETPDEDEDEEEDDKAGHKARGTLIHGLLLGGGSDFVTVMREFPPKKGAPAYTEEAANYQSNSAQEHRDAIRAAGKVPIIGSKRRAIEFATEQLRPKIPLSQYQEVTLIWESEGVLCRSRIDGLTIGPDRAVIRDLKSCLSAMRASSGTNILKMGYHIQAAANIDAVESLYPHLAGRVEFVLHFAEINRPWDTMERDLDGELLELGQRAWKRSKEAWGKALASGVFPGYEKGRKTIAAPVWAMAADLDAQVRAMGEGGSRDVSF